MHALLCKHVIGLSMPNATRHVQTQLVDKMWSMHWRSRNVVRLLFYLPFYFKLLVLSRCQVQAM